MLVSFLLCFLCSFLSFLISFIYSFIYLFISFFSFWSAAEKIFFSAPDHIRSIYDYEQVQARNDLTEKPGVMEDPIVVVRMLADIVNEEHPGRRSFNYYPGLSSNFIR